MDTNIANNIDAARARAHIRSQAELSRLSGIPESTLSRILKGASPSLENLSALAEVCKTTVDALISGNFEPGNVTPYPLVHVSQDELTLLTLYRKSSRRGQKLIFVAAQSSEKLDESTV